MTSFRPIRVTEVRDEVNRIRQESHPQLRQLSALSLFKRCLEGIEMGAQDGVLIATEALEVWNVLFNQPAFTVKGSKETLTEMFAVTGPSLAPASVACDVPEDIFHAQETDE